MRPASFCMWLCGPLRWVAMENSSKAKSKVFWESKGPTTPNAHPPQQLLRDKWWQNKPFHKAWDFLCEGICIGGGSPGFPWMDVNSCPPGLDCLLKAGNPECVVWFLAKSAPSKTQRRFTATFDENHQINSNTCLQNKDVLSTTFQPPRHFVVTSWYRECESNPGRLQLAATVAESSWGCEKTWDFEHPSALCQVQPRRLGDLWLLDTFGICCDSMISVKNTQKSY